jgi:hypothetical protein
MSICRIGKYESYGMDHLANKTSTNNSLNMGARTQVYIKDTKVYLYSHWGSQGIRKTVATALAKHWRWTDPEYLARIIFDEMTKGQHNTETGFGISTQEHLDIDNLITMDCSKQKITYKRSYEKTTKEYTFELFIKKFGETSDV